MKRGKKLLGFIFVYLPAGLLALSLMWVLLYRVAPVRWTPLMLRRSIEYAGEEGYRNRRVWVGLDEVAPVMVRAVMASEDSRFMEHKGFAFDEIRKMRLEHRTKGKKIRGCSTISQQVAKNCFTFGTRSWLRKGVEAYYTVLIEAFWGKRRIMEVYLNVAEMGKGIFGVEAAANEYFGCHASELTATQAVSLACVLPNPLVRNPRTVPQKNRTKYNATIRELARTPYPFKDSGN